MATATGTLDTTGSDGTLWWVVTQSATAPSAAQIMAGLDHADSPADASGNQAVTASGAQTIPISGLVEGTDYWAHAVHIDGLVQSSGVITSNMFTPEPLSPPLSLVASGQNNTGSFTGLNFGAADANRKLIAVVNFRDTGSSSSFTISSLTTSGLTWTRRARARTANDYINTEYWTASAPSGVSGDITINMNTAGVDTWTMALYRAVMASESPTSINQAGTADNAPITIPANGFALATGAFPNGSNNLGMTGIATKDFATGLGEAITGAPGTEFWSEMSTPGASITPTFTGTTSSTGRRMLSAAWAF